MPQKGVSKRLFLCFLADLALCLLAATGWASACTTSRMSRNRGLGTRFSASRISSNSAASLALAGFITLPLLLSPYSCSPDCSVSSISMSSKTFLSASPQLPLSPFLPFPFRLSPHRIDKPPTWAKQSPPASTKEDAVWQPRFTWAKSSGR